MSGASGWPTGRRVTERDLQAPTDRGERWAMLTIAPRTYPDHAHSYQ